MKRVTVHVDESYLQAREIEAALKSAGVDVKIVTRHAVQIAPQHVDLAVATLKGRTFLRCVGADAPEGAPDSLEDII